MVGPAAPAKPKGKTVIRNVGMMLSGALENPILEANTLVAIDGEPVMSIPVSGDGWRLEAFDLGPTGWHALELEIAAGAVDLALNAASGAEYIAQILVGELVPVDLEEILEVEVVFVVRDAICGDGHCWASSSSSGRLGRVASQFG